MEGGNTNCRIENMIVSARFENTLELEEYEYNPQFHIVKNRSSATYARSEDVSVQFYRNGKIICSGCRSFKEAESALNDSIAILGIKETVKDVAVSDILISTRVDHDLNLEKLLLLFGTSAEYNPEWFTGLILTEPNSNLKAIIYSSGKILVSGTADTDTAYEYLRSIAVKV